MTSIRSIDVYLIILAILTSCNQVKKTDGQVQKRHIELAGELNFRDLGGYKTKDGKTIKWGQVYRSGKLSNLSDADVVMLDSLNIQTVVNFLNPEEIEHDGTDRLPEGVRTISNPIEAGEDWTLVLIEARKTGDFSKVPKEINPEFHRILTNEAMEQYAVLFTELLDSTNRPLVMHCSHGIHRTGTAAAIILWTLGVPWETIQEDYLLSNEFRQDQINMRLGQLRTLAAKNQGIRENEVDMENVEAFYVLQDFYIDAARDEIIENYGSIENYIDEGLGISKSEIEKLKSELLF